MNKNITRRKKLLQIATSLSYIDPDDIPTEIDLYYGSVNNLYGG